MVRGEKEEEVILDFPLLKARPVFFRERLRVRKITSLKNKTIFVLPLPPPKGEKK
jgi:hypothetical protein